MQKNLLTICLAIVMCLAFTSCNSTPESVPSDVYKLYPTKNFYIFLQLNTRNGRLNMVQWNQEEDSRFIIPLSDVARCALKYEQNGRFTLTPTENFYNFILHDQINGKCWQVQWSTDPEGRMVVPIP